MSSEMPKRRPACTSRRTCPPSKKSASDRVSQPSTRERSGFAGQSGICAVAKPPVEVQRPFSMPQIEVTTRQVEREAATPKPCEKTRNNNCPRPARAPCLCARSPTARPHRVPPRLLVISARQDSHPAVAAQLLGRVRWVRRNSPRNSQGPCDHLELLLFYVRQYGK